jgi:hypothetical protein
MLTARREAQDWGRGKKSQIVCDPRRAGGCNRRFPCLLEVGATSDERGVLGLVRVMQALIFAGLHGVAHLGDRSDAVPVLEGPHALEMEKRHAVAVAQGVAQIRLEAGHGAQVPIYERNPARFGGHVQVRQ